MAARPSADANPVEVLCRESPDLVEKWREYIRTPSKFVVEELGAAPDQWQIDALDAVTYEENIAVQACHGAGKTAFLAWLVITFTVTRPFCRVMVTAPTFNKQVRDVLFAEINFWWLRACERNPWFGRDFEISTTRLRRRDVGTRKFSLTWFAVGIASNKPVNTEGFHAEHVLIVVDEAKGVRRATWESIEGMRTTHEATLVAVSTPGGPGGEFHKICTRYKDTWPCHFKIHPLAIKDEIGAVESPPGSRGGTYYSPRPKLEWCRRLARQWGRSSPVYVAKVRGEFPLLDRDVLIVYQWIVEAQDREEGIPGPRWVSCDVARYGKDRTVFFVGEGGRVLHCEVASRFPGEDVAVLRPESTIPEVLTVGVGADPKRPRYRGVDVTADICQRLRREWDCEGICLDDTGLSGVADILRRRGEHVLPISFGAAPTDIPRTPEARKSRERRHLPLTHFHTIKDQMAWALRDAFETGQIALNDLVVVERDETGRVTGMNTDTLDPLVQQLTLVRVDYTPDGRIRVVDPDEADEESSISTADDEGKKSPDHFHSLMLLWWACGTAYPMMVPRGGAAPGSGKVQIAGRGPTLAGQARTQAGPSVGGQARHLGGLYRPR